MTTKEMIIHKSSFSSVASLPLKSASLALCLQPSFLPLIKELSGKEILNPWPMPFPRFLFFFFWTCMDFLKSTNLYKLPKERFYLGVQWSKLKHTHLKNVLHNSLPQQFYDPANRGQDCYSLENMTCIYVSLSSDLQNKQLKYLI